MKLLTLLLLAFSFPLLSCTDSGTSNTGPDDTTPPGTDRPGITSINDTIPKDLLESCRLLVNVLNTTNLAAGEDEEEYGHEISIKDALACIEPYDDTMKKHGIERRRGQPRNLEVISRMITTSEEFKGPGLLQWMLKSIRILDPNGEGKDIRFEMHLGIYTDKFLMKYLPNKPRLRDKKKDRITIFIIPKLGKGKGFSNRDLMNQAGIVFDENELTAYELGGLHP